MNPFNEMVLIPKDEYTRLNTQALQRNVPSMQRELEEIKLKYGDSLADDQKLRLESEVVSKYTDYCQPSTQEQIPTAIAPTASSTDENDLIKQQLENFPQLNRWRALQIYNHLKTTNPNQWNIKSQLLDDDKNPIIGSNIVDLIDYVTNIKRIQTAPIGLTEFITIINDSNLPQRYMSTFAVNKIHKHIKAASAAASAEEYQLQNKAIKHKQEIKSKKNKKRAEKRRIEEVEEEESELASENPFRNWVSLPGT